MFEFDDEGYSEKENALETAKNIASFYRVLISAGMSPDHAFEMVKSYFFVEMSFDFGMGDDLFGGLF